MDRPPLVALYTKLILLLCTLPLSPLLQGLASSSSLKLYLHIAKSSHSFPSCAAMCSLISTLLLLLNPLDPDVTSSLMASSFLLELKALLTSQLDTGALLAITDCTLELVNCIVQDVPFLREGLLSCDMLSVLRRVVEESGQDEVSPAVQEAQRSVALLAQSGL